MTDPVGSPRTLADELRARSDAELAELLHMRPDLLSPLPGDVSQLATRAGTRASVLRALDRLDSFALQTAEALAVLGPPARRDALAELLPQGTDELPRALATLRHHALLWGGQDALRLVRTAQELLAPSPQRPGATGLGPSLAETVGALSPRRAQELLATLGLPGTGDPVGAARALTGYVSDRQRLRELVAEAPERAREVLDRLVWGPPYGEVTAQPAPHLRWLLDRALLVPTAPGTVVLPREVALGLREGRAHRDLAPLPPPVTVRAEYPAAQVDSTAAGQALTAVGRVEALLGHWEEEPPPVLRSGGLGVRELKRTAVALDVAEPEAVFWTELAYAAGLVASDGSADDRYAPTPDADEWLALPPQERWVRLVSAWLAGTRVPGLVGERAPHSGSGRGSRSGTERMLAALGPGLDRGPAAELRQRALRLLAELPAGAAADPAALRARLRWEAPRRMPVELHTLLCAAALTEAEHLGVTSRTALPVFARPLVAGPAPAGGPGPERSGGDEAGTGRSSAGGSAAGGSTAGGWTADGSTAGGTAYRGAQAAPHTAEATDDGGAADAADAGRADAADAAEAEADLAPAEIDTQAAASAAAELLLPLLPQPVDHFLLQADLTAVAPGPLLRNLSRSLALAADVESTGGATVYRFTPASVRRALDAGWTAAELQAFLTERSRTPVPQPLSYLVDDVARRYGQLRAGAAAGYLRCDDEALLTQLLADRRLEPLGLRRLASTVAVSPLAPDVLLARLREEGYAPAADGVEGAVVAGRAEPRRTPPRRAPAPEPDGPPATDGRLLRTAVRAIRSGDHAAGGPPPGPAAGPAGGAGRHTPEPSRPLPRTTAAETLTALRESARTGGLVWIGHVGADGIACRRMLAPVRVEGGFVTAFDHTAEEVRTYPVHRITGVAPVGAESDRHES